MTTTVPGAAYPSQLDLLNAMLSGLRFFYSRLTPPITRNVLPGSDDYKRLEQLAGRITIVITNNNIALLNSSPITATGVALQQLASLFNVFPRPASAGAGSVTATFSGASLTIPTNFTCTAASGKQFTATPATYAPGVPIPITAVTQGSNTNLPANAVLQWDLSVISGLNPLCLVTAAGVTGGTDPDTDEPLRTRLLQALANAAGGGNASEVVQLAEAASAAVQAAYCYPAAECSASYDVALTVANGNRTLAAATVAQVATLVIAQMPGQMQPNFTSVTAQYVDISVYVSLPLPQLASGAGGGYRDSAPYPKGEDVKCTAYTAPNAVFASTGIPVIGNSIGIWDSTYTDPTSGLVGIMREYTISSVTGSGPYTVQVQGGFVTTPLNCYVSTGALHLVQYAQAIAQNIALLGPGEKTASPDLLPRAARQPAPDVSSPAVLSHRVLDTLDQYPEILDYDFSVRYAVGTTTPLLAPSVPGTTADPPNILVLGSLALRAQ